MKQKIRKLLISQFKKTIKIGFKKTPRKVINSLNFLISNSTKKKLKTLVGIENKPDLTSFLSHEMAITQKYGAILNNYEISYLNNDLNKRIIEHIKNLNSLKGESLIARMCECIDDRSQLLLSDYGSNNQEEIARKLSSSVINEGFELDHKNELILKIHDFIRDKFKDYFRSPMAIVNSRAWYDYPSSEDFGPNKNHFDGFEPGHLKVMIYPYGLSDDNGSLLIGDQLLNNEKPGCCIAFKNSDVIHAHVPGKNKRLSIEITLQRTFKAIPQLNPSHFNGRHLNNPRDVYLYSETNSNILPENITRQINVGSGYRDWHNWLLLDELKSKNIYRFKIKKDNKFPVLDNVTDLIYSSHHIEHLSDEDFFSLLTNSKRVLKKNALILLKFPNYDYFINQYIQGEKNFMENKGIESINWSWKNKNLEDNIENRLASMFCAYWNNSYGDHFSGDVNRNTDAYHGPPVLPKNTLIDLFTHKSPKFICNFLVKEAKKDKDLKSFNHRNAWSKDELIKIMNSFKFTFLSDNKDYIFHSCGYKIPDYSNMKNWSSYMLFKSD